MWAFESFPAKIEHPFDSIYQVEIFGYANKLLVMFREINPLKLGDPMLQSAFEKELEEQCRISDPEIGSIRLLPIHEFEEKFKKFKLVR